jgi:hypothetical protein
VTAAPDRVGDEKADGQIPTMVMPRFLGHRNYRWLGPHSGARLGAEK